jgi:hypothetical protein
MKALCISGGATKAIQLAIAAIETMKIHKPDIIAGVSAGAMIALPLALGMYSELLYEASHITPDDMFTVNPVKKGNISMIGWIRAIQGVIGKRDKHKYSFGVQDTRHFLLNFITQDMYDRYIADSTMPDILVMSVDMTTGQPYVSSAKSMTRMQFIERVEESSHIPIFTDAVNGRVDGGLWAHNPAWYLLEHGYIKPNAIISIYSREQQFRIPVCDKWRDDVFNNIKRTQQISNVALSTCGQSMTYWWAKANGAYHKDIFCPQVLDEMYDFDEGQIRDAMEKTLKSVTEQLAKP